MTCQNMATITTSHDTMFWRALLSLVCICDASVPYHFYHSVEDEDRHDRRGSFVSDKNCQIMAWNAGKSRVRYPRWWKMFKRGGHPLALTPVNSCCTAFGRDYYQLHSTIDLNFLSHPFNTLCRNRGIMTLAVALVLLPQYCSPRSP
jgi:hypothetical protein